ncbi:predicted protein [Sparassis crispa]|uniref:Uncharacterized protein n=1 Tax=Sparassis crispa TaxID=139825 RepID=A0A401GQG6_9APHY|nr:predicted protein [Sparassis crispa]GBE84399.1 predicted protein [Sparassis crispa]
MSATEVQDMNGTQASPAPASNAPPAPDNGYPEQRHAGAVGYGPEYGKGAGPGDKFQGLFEEAKGKVLRKPDVAQHGRDLRTGMLKQREKEQDNAEDPFKKVDQGDDAAHQVPKDDTDERMAQPPSVED